MTEEERLKQAQAGAPGGMLAAPQQAAPQYAVNNNSSLKEAALRTIGMDGQPDIWQEFMRFNADPNYKVRPMGMPYTGTPYQQNAAAPVATTETAPAPEGLLGKKSPQDLLTEMLMAAGTADRTPRSQPQFNPTPIIQTPQRRYSR